VTLSEQEQLDVIRTTLEVAKGRVPVLAGCGGNNTASIVAKGRKLKSIGVTHILSVSPYYNKPTQEGIYQHYRAIRKETGLEIVLYSVQGRTASNVLPETVARLAEEGTIMGIKEASGDINQIQRICSLVGDRIKVLSGDDPMTLPCMAVGGQGVISVASNVIPKPMRTWMDALLKADYAKARTFLPDLLPLFKALFVESNPIPVKGVASLLGLMDAHYRLPMVPPAEGTMNLLKQVLAPFAKV
jgi:4-hydroxy-tetrahydrodipicolinate synthase